MNEETILDQALNGELPDDLLKSMLSDDTRRAEFAVQVRTDAALRALLEPAQSTDALTHAILASVKTASEAKISERILATTRPRKSWASRPVRWLGMELPRWATAAAVLAIGGVIGGATWPGFVRQYELAAVIEARTGKPFTLSTGLPAKAKMAAVLTVAQPVQTVAHSVNEQALPTAKPSAPQLHFDDLMAQAKVSSSPPMGQPIDTTPAPLPTPAAAAPPPAQTTAVVAAPTPPPPMLLTTYARPTEGERIDFEKHVLPILERACFDCHSAKLKKPKGGIRFDDLATIRTKSRTDNLLFPHKPTKSSLYISIAKPMGDSDIMPPAKEGKPLPADEIALIEKWIEQGADFGDWTSARAKQVPINTTSEVVDAANALATAQRIDELVGKGLREHNQAPNGLTDDATFLRRISLDLVGRIPTSDEAQHFLKAKEPDKRSRLVNDLLASNGHVSHMFNYWCDLLRAKDALADDVEGQPYLTWIKRSVRDNVPYDQWAREMLSPSGFGWKAPAAGYYLRDGDNRQTNIEVTATLFLGTQIACAQCHDHPYDKWTRKDYHTFLAWTSGIQASSADASVGSVSGGMIKEAAGRYDRLAMGVKNYDRQAKYRKLSDAVETLQRAAGDGGLVNGAGMPAILPADYQYDDGTPGEALAPAVLFGTQPIATTNQSTADAFAAWVTSPSNPRFSLTLANRLWAKLFGLPFAGPVDQVQDIADCDNPDLAQYLVNVVRESKYDVRQVLRILCLTQAYQCAASAPPSSGDEAYHFPGPIVRRLSAEQVWDSMMALAVKELDQNLDFEVAGTETLEAVTQATKTSDVTTAARKIIAAQEREMKADARRTRKFGDMAVEFAGGTLERASELPQPTPNGHFLRMFGQGNRDFINDSWRQATVPQALLMLNSDFFDYVARSGSPLNEATKRSSGVSDIVRSVFLAVLTREPSKAEIAACLDTLGETRNPKALARTLLTTAEFAFQK